MTHDEALATIRNDVAEIKAHILVTEETAVARLKKANANLRAELRATHAFHKEQAKKDGTMPFETFSKLAAVCHPDKPAPTVEQRTEAFSLLTQWRQRR